ncbi:MAG: thiosulfate oxidation carrier complex protein SoxZ [Rhizobiales bacterium]|nr:thiosulfate oxidation carrier complex protein SoxZ [Hyphomicrobiales bacterium]
MSSPPRIWLSTKSPKKGEVVTVRTIVQHVMETAFRKTEDGKPVPQKIVNRFECKLNGKPVIVWTLGTGVSANPYLEFRFKAEEAGELKMVWTDDDKSVIEAVEKITLA